MSKLRIQLLYVLEPPIEFRLRGTVIPSDSQLDILSIGVEGDALHCVTPFQDCCKANRRGEIYNIGDDGTASTLPLRGENRAIYRNRGSSLVRLNVRNHFADVGDRVGRYRCCLPDGCGEESCIEISLV